VAQETEQKAVMRLNFADRLNVALEASRQTVTNLNEALFARSKTRDKPTPTEEGPGRVCQDEGKSA
jgi:hypothetical protein